MTRSFLKTVATVHCSVESSCREDQKPLMTSFDEIIASLWLFLCSMPGLYKAALAAVPQF